VLDVRGEDDDVLALGDVRTASNGEPPQRFDRARVQLPAFSISLPSLIVRTMSFDSSRYHVPFSNSIAG